MVSHLSGVAKLIKAILTKCYAHSLSLSVKNATKQWKILSDVMCATKEIIALIKFSPKREKILGDIKTSATDERTFSLARRLKTWLRATVCQERFNSLAVLHWHKEKTKMIDTDKIANQFIFSNERRRALFAM